MKLRTQKKLNVVQVLLVLMVLVLVYVKFLQVLIIIKIIIQLTLKELIYLGYLKHNKLVIQPLLIIWNYHNVMLLKIVFQKKFLILSELLEEAQECYNVIQDIIPCTWMHMKIQMRKVQLLSLTHRMNFIYMSTMRKLKRTWHLVMNI